ncbi:MAG TPA: FtsX-like permease family protein, partial [Ilumatobacteraceae bacterium]|nr:FtsX-like permease family protein [Ilumatobacteraceae bacterium]
MVAKVWIGVVVRRSWTSLLFVSLMAGLGGSIVVIALVGAERTRTAVDRALIATDPPAARVESDSHESIEALAAVPGVRAVYPLELYPGRVEGSSADVTLVVTPDPLGRTIDLVDLREGRLPDPGAADEVLLTSVLAETLAARVGDELAFAAVSPGGLELLFSADGPGDQELPPGPELTLTIVGIGDYMVDRVQISSSNATAYVSTSFSVRHASEAGHLGGPSGLGGLGYIWLDAPDGLAGVTERARGASPDAQFEALDDVADAVRRSNRTLAAGAFVFAAAAGLALVAGIAVGVTRHLARSRADHDILRSIGASRRTIVGLAVAETMPAAALAGVVVSTFTFFLSRVVPFGASARRVDPDVGAPPAMPVLLVTGAGAALITIGLAAAAAIVASRTRPARQPRTSASPRGWLAAPVAAATGIRFALSRGLGARPVPVRSALVAGVLGVAGIVGSLAYAGNLRDLEHDTSRWGWTWSVLLDVYYDDAATEANDLASGHGDIAGWALITDVGAQVNGIASRAMSFDVLGGSLPLTLRAGRLPASPDEAVLGAGLARVMHGRVGQIIRVASPQGDIPLTVVGIATLYPNDSDQLAS